MNDDVSRMWKLAVDNSVVRHFNFFKRSSLLVAILLEIIFKYFIFWVIRKVSFHSCFVLKISVSVSHLWSILNISQNSKSKLSCKFDSIFLILNMKFDLNICDISNYLTIYYVNNNLGYQIRYFIPETQNQNIMTNQNSQKNVDCLIPLSFH